MEIKRILLITLALGFTAASAIAGTPQVITFDALPEKTFGNAPFTLAGTSDSALTVSYASSDQTVATVSGATVTIVGAGSTTITATQVGNSTYDAATPVSHVLTVAKANQTITFGGLPAKQFGDGDFAPGASSSSSLTVAYASDTPAVATISAGKIHVVGVGTAKITASQAGDANYNAATSVDQVLTVGKADQTITFSALPAKKFGDGDFGPGAVASSGLGVTFTSSNTAVATIVANQIHIVGSGTSVITAQQAGDGSYNAAPDAMQLLTVDKASQTISFAALAGKTYGDAAFDLSATATSGLTVVFASSNKNVATVSGTKVTIVGAGTATISATQAGSATYKEAPAVTQTLTVAPAAPEITASPDTNVKAFVGTAFLFGPVTMNAHSAPLTFTMTGAPAGLSVNPANGVITGVPEADQTLGAYTLTLTATNVSGADAETINLTLSRPLLEITLQPVSQTIAAGAKATFTVEAKNATKYQWRKNGGAIAGATTTTLTLNNVSAGDAAIYSVAVSNDTDAVESNGAVLRIDTSKLAPAISEQPSAQVAAVNGSVTLSVAASGDALSYQWRRNGVAIAGATGATLTLSELCADSAGEYSVTITNANGSMTSEAVTVTVRGVAYFGTFGGDAGTFALYVNPDRTGVFLGFAKTSGVVLITREVVVGSDGHFSTTTRAAGTMARAHVLGRAVAAETSDYAIAGAIGDDGSLTGSISGLDLTLTAPAASGAATTADYAGFYQAGAVGSSATAYAIVGADGKAYVASITAGVADAGAGTVSASGAVSVTTAGGATATGTVDGSDTLSVAVTGSTGTTTTFVGANNEARTDDEKLVNISTRTQIGAGDKVLIAGFVVSGTAPKTLLIRAVGPTLANYSIATPLSAAQLELFQGNTSVKVATDWSAADDAAAVANAAKRVGAFDLLAGSHDAAMLVTLDPGLYSAVVRGQNGATGVGMVEVYDATVGEISRTQRLINISSRGNAGTGENVMTVGFTVHGAVPKRVLIRGVGPSLEQYGMSGFIAQPKVKVLSGDTTVLEATGINAADQADVTIESLKVGAFPLVAGSADTALIVYLQPGSYTVQLSNNAHTAGLAMLEVYELP